MLGDVATHHWLAGACWWQRTGSKRNSALQGCCVSLASPHLLLDERTMICPEPIFNRANMLHSHQAIAKDLPAVIPMHEVEEPKLSEWWSAGLALLAMIACGLLSP
jgi:hypothetical protein